MQLKNAVEIGDFCRREYIYWPLSSNKKLVFEEVIRHVKGGEVLDLGCGEAGLYWALGYAERADSLSFYDFNEGHIKNTLNQIEEISPQYLQENFHESIEWLTQNGIIHAQDLTDIATDIVEKTDAVSVFNFKTQKPTRRFDTVLCVESLQVVDSQEQLNEQLRNIRSLLKPNGHLLGISWIYNEFNDHTEGLVNLGYDGRLNPDQDAFAEAFTASRLEITELKTVQTPDVNNYHQAVIFQVRRQGDEE